MDILLEFEVSHQSLIPLHLQLQHQLRRLILSGTLPPGSRLPSENQFQQHLCISRNTVRQAFQGIETDGLITRIPGKGTFVTRTNASTRLIHFVTFDFENIAQRLLLTGAEQVARERGYHIVFCNSRHDVREEKFLLHRIQTERIAGALMWSTLADEVVEEIRRLALYQQVHFVMLDRTLDGLPCDYVGSDHYAGAVSAMQHLIDLGHRHVVFLSHQLVELPPVADRLHAYRTMLIRAGATPAEPWLLGGHNSELRASQLLQAYENPNSPEVQQLRQWILEQRPTAIFALHDYMALLAIKAVRAAGLRVPEDVSVVGFDDLDLGRYAEIPLTTVSQSMEEIGRTATQMLIDRLESVPRTPIAVRVPTTLRIRASTGPLKGGDVQPASKP